MPLYYAGIGSRSAPATICRLMTALASKLANLDYTLRSGHADGADYAFELGANGQAELYLPWPTFGHERTAYCTQQYSKPAEWTRPIAASHHPHWPYLSTPVRSLHMRNVHQVLGWDGTEHSQFVVCWTPGAQGGGGTGQAIRVARTYDIPVYDLAGAHAHACFKEFMRASTTLTVPMLMHALRV